MLHTDAHPRRPWLGRLALVALWAMPLLLLLRWGGKGQWTLQLAGVLAILAAAGAVLAAAREARLPPWDWLLALHLPLLLLTLFQALPLGLGHPALAADRQALDVAAVAWAADPDAAWESAAWRAALLAWSLAAVLLLRRVEPQRLVGWLVVAAAVHALGALLLAALAPELPLANGYQGRVRGSFSYPNHAATYWLMHLPLALLWARRLAGVGAPQAWAVPALLVAAVVLSASRGGTLIALVVGVPVLWWVLPRRRRWWWAGGVAVLGLGALWLLNLGEAAARFGQLDQGHGATLNGRLVLWAAAGPLLAGAGVLGFGPDALRLLWRSSGEPWFEPHPVHELHSDPLELVLTHGWLGAALLLAGLGYTAWRLARARGRRHAWAQAGAALGLLGAGLHALADFPFQSPALATAACLLLLVLALAHHDRANRPVQATRPWRWCALAVVLLALALAPRDWAQERASVGAWWAEHVAAERRANDAPVASASAVDAALALPPRGEALAVAQARLALDLHPDDPAAREQARAALAVAASASPASPGAWLERLRLARLEGDRAAAATAARALLRRAPAWPRAQHELLRAEDAGLLDVATAQAVATATLAGHRGHPDWVFPRLARLLGPEAVAARLAAADCPHPLRAAGLPWLAAAADLATWQTAWRHWWRAGGQTLIQPEQALPVAAVLGPDATVPDERLRLPHASGARWRLADQLRAAALPVPATLRAQLDEGAGELLLLEPDPADRAALEAAIAALAVHPGRPLLAARHRELADLRRALDGLPVEFAATTSPRLLAALLTVPEETLDPITRRRAAELLSRRRAPAWHELPAGAWSWWRLDPATPPLPVELGAWTALIVDGQHHAWLRGRLDLRTRVPPGLHRIALIRMPE